MNTEEKPLNLNLLPNQAKFQAERMKLQALFKKIMIYAIVVWVVIVVIVGALYFGSDYVLGLEAKKYSQTLASYKAMAPEVVAGQTLKYRAKMLGQVLKERFEYSSAFERVNSLFKENVKIIKFELKDKERFDVQVEGNGPGAIDYLESRVAEVNEGKVEGVDRAVIGEVTHTQNDDKWKVNLEVYLK